MKNKSRWAGLVFCCWALCLSAQEHSGEAENALRDSKDLTWSANEKLGDNNIVSAEGDYRKAISKSGENAAAPYNLGNAYYEMESFNEAFGRFKQAGELAPEKGGKHKAYHNMGNVFMKNKEYEKAVEAYKESLRNDPTDEETRYNLALAKEMLKKQQQQQNDDNKDNKEEKDKKEENEDRQNQGNNEDKERENKEEKDKGDQGNEGEPKEENKKGDGDDSEEQQQQPEQGQEQHRPNQLSPQQIKNLLEAMQNEEKKVQEKMDARKVRGPTLKNKKDW